MENNKQKTLVDNDFVQCGSLLQSRINSKVRTKDILCSVRIEQHPKGNKQWEIELLLQDCRSSSVTFSKGYLACHLSKDFLTFSITLDGREYWFDRYQAALEFLGFTFESSSSAN